MKVEWDALCNVLNMFPAHDKYSLMVVLVPVRIGLKANWSRQKRDQLTLVAGEFHECALLAILGEDAGIMAVSASLGWLFLGQAPMNGACKESAVPGCVLTSWTLL